MKKWIKDCAVTDVYTVEEFLNKYYKNDRYKGRGKEYSDCLLKSYNLELKKKGYCFMSHHDSVTGEVVSFINSK